ncbi:MAG: hypothetical protein ACI9Y1_001344, partial [Lentisphaeria bacterium]
MVFAEEAWGIDGQEVIDPPQILDGTMLEFAYRR